MTLPHRAPRRRRVLGLAVGVAALAIVSLASIAIGSRALDPATVWQAIVDFDPADDRHLIITELRVPRTIVGLLAGAALGTAGALMQALTRNPLAEPGLLGVNAGAGAAVATGIALFGAVQPFVYIWFAFAGAGLAAVAVYALGGVFRGGVGPVRLTLAGAALSVVLGAYTEALLINFPEVFTTFRFWSVGSLQGRGWGVVIPVGLFIIVGLIAALLLAHPLNAVSMGSDLGAALGVSIRSTQIVSAVAIMLLAGGATAAVGPIGFVGLTAPLIARAVVGPNYRWIIPYSMIFAAVLVVGADVVGRVIASPSEVEAAIITALIGAPVFIAIVRRRRLVHL